MSGPELIMIEDPAPLTEEDITPPPAEPAKNGKAHDTKRRFSKEQIFRFFSLVDKKEYTIKELAAREGFAISSYSYWRKTMGDEYAQSLGGIMAEKIGKKKPPRSNGRGRKKAAPEKITLTAQLREYKRQKDAILADAERQCHEVAVKAERAIAEIDKQIVALIDTME